MTNESAAPHEPTTYETDCDRSEAFSASCRGTIRAEVGVTSAVTPLISSLQQSRTGRDKQRYDLTRRLLACAVITRSSPHDSLQREVLLISSSKHAGEWILPKGGWETDEAVEQCALREAEEEAGVAGQVTRLLGELNYDTSKGKPCRLYGFELSCFKQYDHWAEQSRQRKWVQWNDARALLAGRPELLEMLQRAERQ